MKIFVFFDVLCSNLCAYVLMCWKVEGNQNIIKKKLEFKLELLFEVQIGCILSILLSVYCSFFNLHESSDQIYIYLYHLPLVIILSSSLVVMWVNMLKCMRNFWKLGGLSDGIFFFSSYPIIIMCTVVLTLQILGIIVQKLLSV